LWQNPSNTDASSLSPTYFSDTSTEWGTIELQAMAREIVRFDQLVIYCPAQHSQFIGPSMWKSAVGRTKVIA
jgi:hypothetical protein